MIAVGRWDVDETSAPGRRLLLERAFVARSRGEALRQRLLAACERSLGRAPLARLAAPSTSRAAAPPHEAALAAACAVLGGPAHAWRCDVSIVRPAHAVPVRLLFLRRTAAAAHELVAKVAPARDAGARDALHGEEAALRRARSLDAAVADLVPRVVAVGESSDLAVMIQSALDAGPLARPHRLRWRPGTWSIDVHRALGDWLGRLHAATRHGERSWIHGDAWSRNVLVDGSGALAGVVDWENAGTGAPEDDVLGYLLRSADADLAARGRRAEAIGSDGGRLARWLLLGRGGPAPAARALIAAWARVDREAVTARVEPAATLRRFLDRLRSGSLLRPPRPVDAATLSIVASILAPLLGSPPPPESTP